MVSKSYLTINGKIHGEVSGGVATGYATDALGSVTATVDNSGNVANAYRYKPYGATLAKTGSSADPKSQWVGGYGYRATGRTQSVSYVRARHYGQETGQWTTVDVLWPHQPGYNYAYSSPVGIIDPSGYMSIPPSVVIPLCGFRCQCCVTEAKISKVRKISYKDLPPARPGSSRASWPQVYKDTFRGHEVTYTFVIETFPTYTGIDYKDPFVPCYINYDEWLYLDNDPPLHNPFDWYTSTTYDAWIKCTSQNDDPIRGFPTCGKKWNCEITDTPGNHPYRDRNTRYNKRDRLEITATFGSYKKDTCPDKKVRFTQILEWDNGNSEPIKYYSNPASTG